LGHPLEVQRERGAPRVLGERHQAVINLSAVRDVERALDARGSGVRLRVPLVRHSPSGPPPSRHKHRPPTVKAREASVAGPVSARSPWPTLAHFVTNFPAGPPPPDPPRKRPLDHVHASSPRRRS